MSEDRLLTLPTFDELGRLDDRELTGRIRAIIEHAERGDAANRRGGIELAMIRAQYLTQELVRRDQAKQTSVMIGQAEMVKNCTVAIGIMTLVIMFATILPLVHPH